MTTERYVLQDKDAWRELRKGYFTASQVHRILAEPKTKTDLLSQGAMTYVEERVAELLAPPEPDYYNSQMEHGNETEPQAVISFANKFGFDVNSHDFIYTSVGGYVFFLNKEYHAGGTPDILLPNEIIEIKCPASKTHLKYSTFKTVEQFTKSCPDYYAQMQMNMWLCEKESGVFVTFDDRYYNEKHHLFTLNVPRNEDYIERMKDKLLKAKDYFNQLITNFNN